MYTYSSCYVTCTHTICTHVHVHNMYTTFPIKSLRTGILKRLPKQDPINFSISGVPSSLFLTHNRLSMVEYICTLSHGHRSVAKSFSDSAALTSSTSTVSENPIKKPQTTPSDIYFPRLMYLYISPQTTTTANRLSPRIETHRLISLFHGCCTSSPSFFEIVTLSLSSSPSPLGFPFLTSVKATKSKKYNFLHPVN